MTPHLVRTTPLPNALTASLADDPRTQSLFAKDLHAIHRRTDHMFIALLLFEWIAGIVVALTISPRAWEGSVYHVLSPSPFRWLEHVTSVLFEDVVLIYAIRQSLREMHAIATRQTALEAAMQRAEAADAAKGAFLAQMSHEIRTPMTAILGFADMMALEGGGGRPSDEAVDAIRQNGKHLLTVLD